MAARARRITAEVFQVGGGSLSTDADAAVYLVAFAGEAALIDSGTGRATGKILRNTAAAGIEPRQITSLLLTHCHFDHTGGAKMLRDTLAIPVVCHALDAPYVEAGDNAVTAADWYAARLDPCPVDRKLTGASEAITLGGRTITAIHIPGHSPGSVAYVTTSEGLSVAFAQDVHGPLHRSLLSNASDYQASLKRLIALEADILCEGHYGVITGKRAVEAFIRQFLDA